MNQWYFNFEIGAYTGDRISNDPEISNRPSPNHVFDGEQWQLELKPDWTELTNALTGSAVFAKIWGAAEGAGATTITALKKAMNVGKAFSLIQASLQAQRLDNLSFAIASLREHLSAIPEIGDFNAEEIAWINGLLELYQFPFRLE